MSDKLSELYFDPASTSPRVDELITGVMKRFPGVSASAQARYYEEVHQHLAPLARELEAENARLRANAVAIWNNRAASPAPAIPAVDAVAIRDAALEAAAAAVEDHQRAGREWVNSSLWGSLSREAAARIRALKAAPAISESEVAIARFDSPLTPFGSLVRSLRVVTGTLLGDMARAMGVSSAELSAIEFGRRPITPEQVKATSDFFESHELPRTAPLLQRAIDAARKGEKS
ncbi:gp38 domain protein [Burkholderia gladioli]|uniref:helix-turn-helix domain-containing protein n=1 Tax=Burkholderia gladioli TaxID=28095 RepID=UPI0005D7E99C|nr:helix-turn-helix transcriptional regulator [Burkholderia gladioli]AJW99614.1 gp38 domain protein [Burkholderia gladioli]ASD79119.1 transcriptional regulator [Burkholderia gladioli pv. gladioli]AWY55637.1 transcriptional regulator [Burkholderia gladioli pv. gladioli]SPV21774.1 Uncharacterised protein [Burkholderia gladioli]